jgi:hypothetical protein
MFERKIIEEIKSIWDNHKVCGDMAVVPELDIEDLRVVIETAFFASLKKEESLPIDFSIAFIAQNEISKLNDEHSGKEIQMILQFPEPLDFNVESISKLANAFDKNTTALIVEPVNNELGKSYCIWGAMYFGPPSNYFDISSLSGDGFITSRPNCLIVTVSSPGSFILSRGPLVVGYFSLGNVVATTHSPFLKGAMDEYVQPLINQNNGITWNGDINLETLKFLLFEAGRRGHGSTIIIVPQSQQVAINHITSDGYAFTGNLGISSFLKELLRLIGSDTAYHLKVAEMIKRAIAHRIGALAQLAAVDGALLLTPNWDVIGFGMKLTAEPWQGNVLTGPEAFSNGQELEKIDTSKFGNRHKSTINFIGKCQGAVAFVISEDGPIRGLVLRDSETVLLWKDCRVSSFLENQG